MNILDQTDPQRANQIRLKEFWLGRFCVPVVILFGSFLLIPNWTQPAHGQATTQQSKIAEAKIAEAKIAEVKTAEIKELINLLGSPDHLVRSQSEKSLLEIGEPAIGPLQAVLNFEDSTIVPDNEVRLKATRLLILIQRKAQERKLSEFLDGTRDEIDLAGWPDFRKMTGSNSRSRRLFIRLHQAHPNLLEAPAKGKLETENELHKTIVNRVRLSSNGSAEAVLHNLAAVLFSASQKTKWQADLPPAPPQVTESDTKRIQRVLIQPQMITTLKTHVAGAEIRALVLNWLDSLPLETGSPKHVATLVSVVDAYRLGKRSGLPLRFALDSKLSSHIRSSALAALSRVGSVDDTAKLSPLMNDSTLVGNFLLARRFSKDSKTNEPNADPAEQPNPLLEVQIRDLALATAIIWQEKSLSDFGFYPQAFDDHKLVINQAGFTSEKQRELGFAKWRKLNSAKQN